MKLFRVFWSALSGAATTTDLGTLDWTLKRRAEVEDRYARYIGDFGDCFSAAGKARQVGDRVVERRDARVQAMQQQRRTNLRRMVG